MLLADQSLQAVQTVEQRRQLENDPTAGVNAEGKKLKAARRAAGGEGEDDSGSAPDPAAAGSGSTGTGSAGSGGKATSVKAARKAG